MSKKQQDNRIMGVLGNLVKEKKEPIITANTSLFSFVSSLSSSVNDFTTLIDQIELKAIELDEKERKLNERENNLQQRENGMNEREQGLNKREEKVNKIQEELKNKEEQWKEIKRQMASNSAKLPSLIHFNVGGTRFTIPKSDILKHKGSHFESLINSNHSQVVDNELFINRNPEMFKHVLEYMRSGKMGRIVDGDFMEEFEFYKILIPLFNLPIVYSTLTSWFPQTLISAKLLYKASRDGFAANDFHQMCDNKGPTLCLIQSKEGFIFGGYSPDSWDSSNKQKLNTDTFIFTITNPHFILPTKYIYNNNSKGNTIYCASSYGLWFGGGGNDILVQSDSNKNNISYINFPSAFIDTTGKRNNTFTGERKFTTKEIEVYSLN